MHYFKHPSLCLFVTLVLIDQSKGETDEKLIQKCQQQTKTCEQCVETNSLCSWCYKSNFSGFRCNSLENLKRANCSTDFVYTVNKFEPQVIDKDDPFKDVVDGNTEGAVQIRPQLIKLKLKPGEPETIQLRVKTAKNYPLDLYYLMDLTWSMRNDLNTMNTLGTELTESLGALTDYYRLAFGYFSDKIAMPFQYMTPPFLENPCSMHKDNSDCKLGYDFKHSLNFTKDIDRFIDTINKSTITSTIDNLEGCMDALFQILVCGENIHWKNDSRKLVILATDGLAHFAGDGKLSGTVHKVENKCYLDKNGVYAKSLVSDYPSLEEIYNKLYEKKVNVVIAAKAEVYAYYKKLNNLIPDVTYVTELQENSTNILELVSKGYKNFISIVDIRDNVSAPLTVEYESACTVPSAVHWNKTHACYRVEENQELVFNITFTLEKCPARGEKMNQTVIFNERGIVFESLQIDVEFICGCDCEKDNNEVECGKHGHGQCGICVCDSGWGGSECTCDHSLLSSMNIDDMCRQNESRICNGNGSCFCGDCECDLGYTGKYCECPVCHTINDKVCGGGSQGRCNCGKCECKNGYSGKNCECSGSTVKCMAHIKAEPCNGRGTCKCESCQCKPVYDVFDNRIEYSGPYCEVCVNCYKMCIQYEDVILKYVSSEFDNDLNRTVNNPVMIVEKYNSTTRGTTPMDSYNCSTIYIKLNEQCNITYVYDLNRTLIILSDVCTPAPIAAGQLAFYVVIPAIVLFGFLLLLLYKCRNDIQDRKDWANYQKNLDSTMYSDGENPLYLSPITGYTVPKKNE